jgi:hypothetical protein
LPSGTDAAWAATVLVVLGVGVAASIFVGWLPGALAVAAVAIGLALGRQDRSEFTVRAPQVLGILGSVVAIVSVVSGLAAGYVDRMGFAIIAIVFAAFVAVVPFLRRIKPQAAGAGMFLAGLLGFAATLPWSINTYYSAAVPLWLVAAGLLVSRGLAASRVAREQA